MFNFKQRLLLLFGALVLSGCLADFQRLSSGRSVDSSSQTRAVSDSNSSRSVSSSEKRVALVIGNDAYHPVKKRLKKAVNDAKVTGNTLKNLGFKVIYAEDADANRMRILLGQFANEARGSALALFYFAGHGAQYGNENFLLSTDFDFSDLRKDMENQSLQANQVLATLEQTGVPSRILILDACRDWDENRGSLAYMKSPAKFNYGTLIAFSTAPGNIASDGGATDVNSPYTKALVKYMPQGLPIKVMFDKVREEVRTITKDKQISWVNEAIDGGDLCLAPCVKTSTDGTSICKAHVGQGYYDGECQNGIPHGQGVLRYSDGEYYQGNFSNGVRHGRGIQYLTDGTEVRGVWMNGRLQ